MSLCSLWMAGMAWCPPTRRSPTACARRTCRCSSPSTRPTTGGRSTARSSSTGWASSRSSRLPPSMAQGTGDLLDEVDQAPAGAVARPVAGRRTRGSRGRHRRPPQCRQVLAAQSVAAEKSARSSATCPGRPGTASTRSCAGRSGSSALSIRPESGARARSRGRASSRTSASSSPGGRSRRRT